MTKTKFDETLWTKGMSVTLANGEKHDVLAADFVTKSVKIAVSGGHKWVIYENIIQVNTKSSFGQPEYYTEHIKHLLQENFILRKKSEHLERVIEDMKEIMTIFHDKFINIGKTQNNE